MKTYTNPTQVSDEVFIRYKQDAEEIEKLIEIAEKNYFLIEQLRKTHTLPSRKAKSFGRKKARSSFAYK